jgi:type VI secretion system secreted protein Hcp
MSFSWGAARAPGPTAGAGASAGAGKLSSLEIKKLLDKASPALREAAVAGTHLKLVVLEMVHPTKHEFYQITMSDVLVSGITLSPAGASSADRPVESLTLNFTKIEVKYQPTKPDGSLDTLRPVPAGWDVATNTKV